MLPFVFLAFVHDALINTPQIRRQFLLDRQIGDFIQDLPFPTGVVDFHMMLLLIGGDFGDDLHAPFQYFRQVPVQYVDFPATFF